MTAHGARLKLRLFLEGCEVPVVAASITSQKNAAASASIQIPANDYALDLKPRTLVHLFAYDGYKGAPPESQVWVQGAGITVKQQLAKDPDLEGLVPTQESVAGSPTLSAIDLENMNFKLVFGGEVVAVHYSKTPMSRGVNLQCVDWSSYWDIAYQYQVSGMSLGFGNLNQAFTGASTTVFNEFLKTSGDIVLDMLSSPPRSYPELKGSLLGGLMHIIEAIGGCYFGLNAVKGTNDFFSLAEMRLHLTQMVGANPRSATDEVRLMKANGFGSLFGKTLGGLGQLVTIRQVLNALQRYIFHEVIPITSPRYVPPKASPEMGQRETLSLTHDPKTAVLSKAAQRIKRRALELKAAQERATNISVGGSMTDFTQLSRASDEAYRKAKKAATETGVAADTGGLTQVATSFETCTQQLLTVGKIVQMAGSTTYEFPPMDTSEATRVIQLLTTIAKTMGRVIGMTYSRAALSVTQGHPPPRLITQIYRPDVWMVAPPRCNVIFPELYSQFSYGRNFLGEATRLLLRTHEAFYGSDMLFDGYYMAPSKILGARQDKKMSRGRMDYEPPDLSDAPASVLKDLMDHELYTGISPVFERMSDLNLHAIRGGSIEMPDGVRVGYAQLACNHIFFGYRFRARELSVSGKFNMYAALGFPAVVIDKYVTDDKLRGGYDSVLAKRLAESFANLPPEDRDNIKEINAAKIDELAGNIMNERMATHFLGTPEMIAHSVSATSGGNTSYQMSYARTTTEKTEFFGDNIGRAVKAKKKGKKNPWNVIASRSPPEIGSAGVVGGKIIQVTDVTSEYTRAQPKKGGGKNRHGSRRTLPLFEGGNEVVGRKNRATRVPVGIDQPATAYNSSEVIAIVNSGGTSVAADGNVYVIFRAYKVVEEVGQYIIADKSLAPEHLLFPPWYGEDYRTHKIGALYSDFFGVGAITDPTVVLGSAIDTKFGEGDADRTMYVDLQDNIESVMTREQHPPPGMSQVAEPEGGGVIGTDRAGVQREILGEIEGRSPVAEAIGEIVKIYSATRQEHYDTPSFVQNFTWRPIATMVDIFGTSDLVITDRGTVTAGREGFHSRAFGKIDDLRQLVTQDDHGPQKILGLKAAPSELNADEADASKKVAQRLDTRKEKQDAVFRYLTALAASRGVLLG